MTIDTFTAICRQLPSVTEEMKWGNDLCFMVGNKMFCVIIPERPVKVSIKVLDEEFTELSDRIGIIPAPYAARYKWILVEDVTVFKKSEWKHYINQSYNLVRSRLPKKLQRELGLGSCP
ncbi:MAG TPA: MmcQ/YjbR family DNA-binding protein [Cyclobacteriaceae bacterium]|nr:MmcQ/YjbR family DNA-binding protein [Cyclobacteriaceae bacterium]